MLTGVDVFSDNGDSVAKLRLDEDGTVVCEGDAPCVVEDGMADGIKVNQSVECAAETYGVELPESQDILTPEDGEAFLAGVMGFYLRGNGYSWANPIQGGGKPGKKTPKAKTRTGG